MKPKPKIAPKPPSLDDVWADVTREKCARAIALWLKATVNTKRPINTLTLPELTAMAENAVATWLVEASRRQPEPFTDVNKEIIHLLV